MSPAHKCTSWHKFILNVQMYQKEPWKWKVSLRNQVTREWAINRIWTMCQKNWKIWHFILHIENARHLENCKIEAVIWSQESFLLQYNNMTTYMHPKIKELTRGLIFWTIPERGEIIPENIIPVSIEMRKHIHNCNNLKHII